MRPVSRFLLTLMFLIFGYLPLQANNAEPISFSVSSESVEIPSYDSDKKQIGIAGPITGKLGSVFIVGGGANFPDAPPWENGKKVWYRSLIVFEKNRTGKWQPHPKSFDLPEETGYAASASTPYGLAVLGGENGQKRLDSAYLLRWNSAGNTLERTELAPLPYACSNAGAVWLGSRIYLCGGMTNEGETDRVLSLDPSISHAKWREEPRLPRPVAFAFVVKQSDGTRDRIWLAGGRANLTKEQRTEFYDSLWSWYPGQLQWRVHAPIQTKEGRRRTLAAGTGIACGMSCLVLFGGDDGELFRQREQTLQKIQQTNDSSVKEKLRAEYVAMSKNHPGFDSTIYLYNTITDKWTDCGTLPFKTPVTTNVMDMNGEYLFPSGETAPGVRTPLIHFIKPVGDTHFGILNYSVLFLYMAGMLGIGFLFARSNKSSEDFFHCGGQIPWWAMGISLFATMLSAITFLAIPAKSYATNWNMLFFNFGIALIAPLVIAFYIPRFRRIPSISAYQYLEERFNRTTRWFASGLFTVFMVSRIAIVLYLPAIALNVVTGMNVHLCIIATGLVTLVYSTMGGMKAVVWGDVVQGIILVGGAILSLIWLIVKTDGGWNGFIRLGTECEKFHCFDMAFDATSPVFWVVLIGGCVSAFVTYTSDQTVIQRYMSTSTQKESERSIWLNAIMSIPITFVFFLIGTALFTYYSSHPERLTPTLKPMDAIYPYYIVTSLPAGIAGLLVAAIFAASMSTLSSNINSAAAAICADFVKIFQPALSSRHEVVAARVSGLVVGILGIVMACVLATWNIQSLWDQFNTFLGMFTGTLGALFFMGFFMKNVRGFGAVTGVFGSVLLLAVIQRYTPISFLLYAPIEIIACCLIASVCSYFRP